MGSGAAVSWLRRWYDTKRRSFRSGKGLREHSEPTADRFYHRALPQRGKTSPGLSGFGVSARSGRLRLKGHRSGRHERRRHMAVARRIRSEATAASPPEKPSRNQDDELNLRL